METLKNKSTQSESGERGYIAWGAVAGAVLGAIVGAFTGHWVSSAFLVGVFGLLVGALIDRSRR